MAEGEKLNDEALNNYKKDIDTKLSAQDATLKKLMESNQLLLKQMQGLAQPPRQKEEKKEKPLSDLMYDDPEEYTRIIEDRATKKAQASVEQMTKAQTERNQVLMELTSEYPELNDTGNALTKKAIEIYNSFPDNQKESVTSYERAVLKAATQLGVKPKSARGESEDEEFDLKPKGSSRRKASNSQGEFDPNTEKFAELIGLFDLGERSGKSREKLLEGLKRTSQRTNWKKYQ